MTVTNNDPEGSKSIIFESKLLEIGRYPIKVNQIIGYLPLKICTNKEKSERSLCFRIFSFPTFIPILNISIFIFNYYIWIFLSNNGNTYFKLTKQTDVTTANSMNYFTSLMINYCKIVGLLLFKSTLKFWDGLLTRLEAISSSHANYNIGTTSGILYSKIFCKLQSKFRFWCAVYCIMVWAYFIIFFVWFDGPPVQKLLYALSKSKDGLPSNNTGVIMAVLNIAGWFAGANWYFWGMCHYFYFFWLIFPLSISAGYLEMIYEELVDMNSLRMDYKFFKRSFKTPIVEPFGGVNENIVTVSHSTGNNLGNLIVNEARVINCVENYYRICDLVTIYNDHFGYHLLTQITYTACIILGYSFLAIGFLQTSSSHSFWIRLVSLITSVIFLVELGTAAGDLEDKSKQILNQLCILPKESLGKQSNEKITILIIKISGSPLTIDPGSFFTLNRRLITSILSAIITFLIVLVQFRDGESQP